MTGESNLWGLWGNTTHNPVNPQKKDSKNNSQPSGGWWQPSNSFIGVLASFADHITKDWLRITEQDASRTTEEDALTTIKENPQRLSSQYYQGDQSLANLPKTPQDRVVTPEYIARFTEKKGKNKKPDGNENSGKKGNPDKDRKAYFTGPGTRRTKRLTAEEEFNEAAKTIRRSRGPTEKQKRKLKDRRSEILNNLHRQDQASNIFFSDEAKEEFFRALCSNLTQEQTSALCNLYNDCIGNEDRTTRYDKITSEAIKEVLNPHRSINAQNAPLSKNLEQWQFFMYTTPDGKTIQIKGMGERKGFQFSGLPAFNKHLKINNNPQNPRTPDPRDIPLPGPNEYYPAIRDKHGVLRFQLFPDGDSGGGSRNGSRGGGSRNGSRGGSSRNGSRGGSSRNGR